MAVLRNRTFFSLHELREAVKVLVTRLNDRPMQQLKKSRRELFEELERATLAPLPVKPYEFAEWAKTRVHIDYHVQFDEHFYSVPYQLVGEQLELRATATTVELLRGKRKFDSLPDHRHAKSMLTLTDECLDEAAARALSRVRDQVHFHEARGWGLPIREGANGYRTAKQRQRIRATAPSPALCGPRTREQSVDGRGAHREDSGLNGLMKLQVAVAFQGRDE